jgi:acetyl esterase/lipase
VPAVIWIHGGGWVGGSKSAGRETSICRTLAENGYAAFSINYQLARDTTKPDANPGDPAVAWPQNIYDCKSALRYIRKEAATFGVDPARIAVSGGSAGAHLALVLGLSGDDEALNKGGLYTDQSNKVSCIIDFYGPTVITDAKRIAKFTGKDDKETEANVLAASPILHVKKDSPPVLVAHGTKDGTCDISYSRNLVEKMKEVGTQHEYIEVEGAGHSFNFQPAQMDLRPAILAFLGKHLGKP